MKITYAGLIAGVRFLNVHCLGFDIGTGVDFNTPFIRDLLSEVHRASGITLEMPLELPDVPEKIVSTDHQGKAQLLAFLVGPDGEHLVSTVDRLLSEEGHD